MVISDFSLQVKNNLMSQMMWIVIVGRVVTFFLFLVKEKKVSDHEECFLSTFESTTSQSDGTNTASLA
jgi:F0F1-type ATP synthase membrane subunit a